MNNPYLISQKTFPGGREAHVNLQLFNANISIGPAGASWYDDKW